MNKEEKDKIIKKMKNKKDFYRLSDLDKDKIMFFYFAPNGIGKKFWDNKIEEIKKRGD